MEIDSYFVDTCPGDSFIITDELCADSFLIADNTPVDNVYIFS